MNILSKVTPVSLRTFFIALVCAAALFACAKTTGNTVERAGVERTYLTRAEADPRYSVQKLDDLGGYHFGSSSLLPCRQKCSEVIDRGQDSQFQNIGSGEHKGWRWNLNAHPKAIDFLSNMRESDKWQKRINDAFETAMKGLYEVSTNVAGKQIPPLKLEIQLVTETQFVNHQEAIFDADAVSLKFFMQLSRPSNGRDRLIALLINQVPHFIANVGHEYAHTLFDTDPQRFEPILELVNNEAMAETFGACASYYVGRRVARKYRSKGAQYSLYLQRGPEQVVPIPVVEPTPANLRQVAAKVYLQPKQNQLGYILGRMNLLHHLQTSSISYEDKAMGNRLLSVCNSMFSQPRAMHGSFYPTESITQHIFIR